MGGKGVARTIGTVVMGSGVALARESIEARLLPDILIQWHVDQDPVKGHPGVHPLPPINEMIGTTGS
jgi:hypothetical protein